MTIRQGHRNSRESLDKCRPLLIETIAALAITLHCLHSFRFWRCSFDRVLLKCLRVGFWASGPGSPKTENDAYTRQESEPRETEKDVHAVIFYRPETGAGMRQQERRRYHPGGGREGKP